MRYLDCSITIRANGEVVYAEAEGARTKELQGRLALDPVVERTVQRLNYWIREDIIRASTIRKKPLCESDDLKLLGTHLYRMLFASENIRASFEAAVQRVSREALKASDRKLRLNVIFEDTSDRLATLPWEFLFVTPSGDMDSGVFLAGERTELLLSRKLVMKREQDALERRSRRSDRPDTVLTVLLVECNPDEIDGVTLPPVDADEFTRVRKALATIGMQVNVVSVPDPSFEELRAKLKETQPRIVHYIGHGKPGHIALRKARDEDDYDSHGSDPQYRWLDSNSVKSMFGDVKPRLVFLNACSTGASESIESFKSLARDLLYADVGGVVAMQYGITNGDAAIFAKSFYEAIARGAPIDEAAKAGRKELGSRMPPWAHPRFATPIVYVQDNEPIVAVTSPPGGSDPDAQRQGGTAAGADGTGGLTA